MCTKREKEDGEAHSFKHSWHGEMKPSDIGAARLGWGWWNGHAPMLSIRFSTLFSAIDE